MSSDNQQANLKVIVTDHGDDSVGIFAYHWEFPVPFDNSKDNFDNGNREKYMQEIKKLVDDWFDNNGQISLRYSDECDYHYDQIIGGQCPTCEKERREHEENPKVTQ